MSSWELSLQPRQAVQAGAYVRARTTAPRAAPPPCKPSWQRGPPTHRALRAGHREVPGTDNLNDPASDRVIDGKLMLMETGRPRTPSWRAGEQRPKRHRTPRALLASPWSQRPVNAQ